jgi:hypothetical protein
MILLVASVLSMKILWASEMIRTKNGV